MAKLDCSAVATQIAHMLLEHSVKFRRKGSPLAKGEVREN